MNEPTHQPPATVEQLVEKIRKVDVIPYCWNISAAEAVALITAHVAQVTAEKLRHSCKVDEETAEELTILRTLCAKQKDILVHISEYWNGGNESAVNAAEEMQASAIGALSLSPANVADELAAKDKRIAELESEKQFYFEGCAKAEKNEADLAQRAESAEVKVNFIVDALFAAYELLPEGSIKEQCDKLLAPYEAIAPKAEAKGDTP